MGPVLVTGGSGQVGSALRRLAPAGIELATPDRAALDLADPSAIATMVAARPWAAVVNAGAYTAVDRAESDVVAAWTINALAPAALAQATAAAGIPLVHLSTDYVFDGSKPAPYREDDPVAPLGVYGASKEGGEQAVRTANPRHLILRTAWVVSADGANFVKTMLRLAAERPELRVVADQHGCPTAAADIAATILALLPRLVTDADAHWGTYHFVNGGEASWHALARAVVERAGRHGRAVPRVTAIATADYPTPARRPANSRLSTAKIAQDYGIVPRGWEEAVDEIVDQLMTGEHARVAFATAALAQPLGGGLRPALDLQPVALRVAAGPLGPQLFERLVHERRLLAVARAVGAFHGFERLGGRLLPGGQVELHPQSLRVVDHQDARAGQVVAGGGAQAVARGGFGSGGFRGPVKTCGVEAGVARERLGGEAVVEGGGGGDGSLGRFGCGHDFSQGGLVLGSDGGRFNGGFRLGNILGNGF